MISDLAALGLARAGRAAISSYGWQAGKSAYRHTGDVVGLLVLAAIAFAPIAVPYMAGWRMTRWYPNSRTWFFFQILMKWGLLMAFVSPVVWAVIAFGFLLSDPIPGSLANVWNEITRWPSFPATLQWTVAVIGAVFGIGAIKGLSERADRKEAHKIASENQEFLDRHGLRTVDGKSVTHVDGDGNRLRLDHAGENIVEFVAADGRGRAFINVADDGRFVRYSGLIS
jgi:hypothetical protein